MKYCPHCGSALNDNSVFCKFCGWRVLTPNQNQSSFPNNMSTTFSEKNNYSLPKLGIISMALVVIITLALICFPQITPDGYDEIYRFEICFKILIVIITLIFIFISIFVSKNYISKIILVFCFIVFGFIAMNYIPYALRSLERLDVIHRILIPVWY